ncbi:MAG: phage holin family protein [Candidatus Nitrotoga sp.]
MGGKHLAVRWLLIWVYNALALLAVAYVLPGIHIDGLISALVAAIILGLVNTVLRPLLVVLTLPVTVRSFGLFIFIINGALFWLVGSTLKGFEVESFWVGVLGALLYSLSSLIPMLFFRRRNKQWQNIRQQNAWHKNVWQQKKPDQKNNRHAPITIDHDPS